MSMRHVASRPGVDPKDDHFHLSGSKYHSDHYRSPDYDTPAKRVDMQLELGSRA